VVETWEPGPHRLPRKVRAAFEFIVGRFDKHPSDLLTIETVMTGIGETGRSNFNKNILKHKGFKQHIADAGIYEERSDRKCLGFRQKLEEPSTFEDYFGSASRDVIEDTDTASLQQPT
jgi:hypothetical protein